MAHKNVDEYITDFPADVQEILRKVRATIKKVVPEAEETIAYGMPAYKIRGKAIAYFAGYSKHIGFYAIPDAHAAFTERLKPYVRGKGSVQLPLDQPIPYDLIEAMVKYNVEHLPKGYSHQ